MTHIPHIPKHYSFPDDDDLGVFRGAMIALGAEAVVVVGIIIMAAAIFSFGLDTRDHGLIAEVRFGLESPQTTNSRAVSGSPMLIEAAKGE